MADFVLAHGACHRSWAWAQVIPALRALGHNAVAVDLIGETLAENAAIIAQAGPAVLVGHSAGGFAITAAPSAHALIYVCAYIPQIGLSVADLRRAGPRTGMRFDISDDRKTYGFKGGADIFFHDCPDPTWAEGQLRRDPIAPVETALTALPDLPRAAIICDHDRAIAPDYQRHMARGIGHITHLPSGHAPFLSMPDRLAHSLSDLAAKITP